MKPERTAALQATHNARQRLPASAAAAYIKMREGEQETIRRTGDEAASWIHLASVSRGIEIKGFAADDVNC
jgi:hypothetical protein